MAKVRGRGDGTALTAAFSKEALGAVAYFVLPQTAKMWFSKQKIKVDWEHGPFQDRWTLPDM